MNGVVYRIQRIWTGSQLMSEQLGKRGLEEGAAGAVGE
jgi:hypothetical protein